MKDIVLNESIGPRQQVALDQEVPVDFEVSRVSLHLLDSKGSDWGVIDNAEVKGKQ